MLQANGCRPVQEILRLVTGTGDCISFFVTVLHLPLSNPVRDLISYFRRDRKITKRDLAWSCLFVHPSAWNNPAPTGRIFMKPSIWGFFENPPRKLEFH
jgi:hypothetical protein